MKTSTELKANSKMRKSIERLEKKYGTTLNKDFGIESNEQLRVGRGFYDYCELTCNTCENYKRTVSHDGVISNC